MTSCRNYVQLIGNLGKDVELRTLDNGSKLANVTLATSSYYKNKEGEKVQETQWHNVQAWGKQAELMQQILSKGSSVLVTGKLEYSNSVDKEGIKRYYSNVVIKEFMKLSKNEKEDLPF